MHAKWDAKVRSKALTCVSNLLLEKKNVCERERGEGGGGGEVEQGVKIWGSGGGGERERERERGDEQTHLYIIYRSRVLILYTLLFEPSEHLIMTI